MAFPSFPGVRRGRALGRMALGLLAAVPLLTVAAGSQVACDSCNDVNAPIRPNGRDGVLFYEGGGTTVQDGMRLTFHVPKHVEQRIVGTTRQTYTPSFELTPIDAGPDGARSELSFDVTERSVKCPDGPLQTFDYDFANVTVTGDAQGTHTFAGASATADGLDVTVGCDLSRVDDPRTDFLRGSPSALTVHVRRGGADAYVDAFRVFCYRGKSVTFAAFSPDGTRVDGTAAAPKQVRVGDELDVRYVIAFDHPLGGSEAYPRLYGEGFASDGSLDVLPTQRVPPGEGRDIYTLRVRAAKPASRPVLRGGPLEGRLNVEIVP